MKIEDFQKNSNYANFKIYNFFRLITAFQERYFSTYRKNTCVCIVDLLKFFF